MSSLRSLLLPCVFAFTTVTFVFAAPHDCHATAFIATTYRDHTGLDYSARSESGAFADGYASSALGELIRVFDVDRRDESGCSRPWPHTTVKSWIAIVRRGGCSVETKIENALRSNASALIIYNNRDYLNLVKLRVSKKFQGLISVVFTYKWKGEELVALLDSGRKVVVDLSIANPCVVDSSDYDRNMQLISVSFLCFIVLTISTAWLVFYYIQRYRDIQARERKMLGYSEADEKALKAIPTKIVKSNDKLLLDESECCAICIDPYKTEEIVRTLTCGHEFHRSCIDPWLIENRTCPMCKKDILRQYGGVVFTGSQESILQVIADESTRLAVPASPQLQIIVVGGDDDHDYNLDRISNNSSSSTVALELQNEPVESTSTTVNTSREVLVDQEPSTSECPTGEWKAVYEPNCDKKREDDDSLSEDDSES